jgi:hypothetical protein
MGATKRHVFVSCAHEDKKIADGVKEDLTRNKVAVWIDEGKLPPGHPLILNMQEAIKKTANFLIFWSKRASRSRWVKTEWNVA